VPVKDIKIIEQLELNELLHRRDENEDERRSIFLEYEQYARRDRRMRKLDAEWHLLQQATVRKNGPDINAGLPTYVIVQDDEPDEAEDGSDTNDIA
jgi:hypothetical protein